MTRRAAPGQASRQRVQGAVIGGTFGSVFLLANAQTPLGGIAADLFRALAVAGFVALMIGRRRALARPARTRGSHGNERVDLFGRRWRLIVAAEVAALAAGYLVIWLTGAPRDTYLPWTVIVVGLHFIAFHLTGIWRGRITQTACVLTALGVGGLALAATPANGWIPFVSGALAGITLLTGSLTSMRRALR